MNLCPGYKIPCRFLVGKDTCDWDKARACPGERHEWALEMKEKGQDIALMPDKAFEKYFERQA